MEFQYVEFSKHFCTILYYFLALLLAKPAVPAEQRGIKLSPQIPLYLAMASNKDICHYWNLSPTCNSIITK